MEKKPLLKKMKRTNTDQVKVKRTGPSGSKGAGKRLVCRTCMSTNELHPLFPQATHYRNFERALFLSTGLQIQANDGLPQNICQKCAKFIESAMRFRSQSKVSEKKLLQIFKNKKKQKLCKDPYSKITEDCREQICSMNKQVKIEDEEIQPKTGIIIEIGNIKNYDPDEDSKIDNGNHTSSDFDDPVPPSPEDAFPTSEDEELSLNTRKTSIRPYLDLIEGPLDNKSSIKCKICKKTSKSLNAFEKHAMSHTGYEILCEFCARRCVSNMQLLRHQRAKHGLARDDSYACKFCEFQALDKEQLESHERRTHTKERPYVCDECGEAFYTKRVLVQHGYCHKTEKPFQCNLCPSKFKLRSRLTSHKNFVHSKRYKYLYGCYICPKTYNKPYEAKKHIVKIHGIPKDQQNKVHRYNRENQGITNTA